MADLHVGPNITLPASSGTGLKTCYFKTRNAFAGESNTVTLMLYIPSATVSAFTINAATPINIQVGDVTFSKTLGEATTKNLKAPLKGGSAVFKTLSGKTTTQLVTVTWTAKKVLKVVVTGTPLTGTGSTLTTNILNALSADDGTIAGTAPIAVGLGSDYARNTTGVVCTGTRTTSTVKGTSVNLNKWIMTGKK